MSAHVDFAETRMLRMSCAALLAGIVFCGADSSARAGCGDYLMPLHAGHAADIDRSPNRPEDLATLSWFPNGEPAPCGAPGCSDAPGESPCFTVLPAPHRNGPSTAFLAPCDIAFLFLWPMARCSLGSDLPRAGMATELLRPPRV